MCANAAGVESVFRALVEPRRRDALRCLQTHGTLSLPDLAELVVERETGAAIADVSAERVSDVYFSLYHTHVPVLVDADLAWYDQEDDLVGITEGTAAGLADARDAVDGLLDP